MELEELKDMKQTPQRLAIIEYLKENKIHPTAGDVYKAVSEKFPTMSFATVYNTLEKLKEKGMLVELSIDPGKKRFDCDLRPHHHLICIRCREVFDVFKDYYLELPEEEFNGFELVGMQVDFYGICRRCKELERKNIDLNL